MAIQFHFVLLYVVCIGSIVFTFDVSNGGVRDGDVNVDCIEGPGRANCHGADLLVAFVCLIFYIRPSYCVT